MPPPPILPRGVYLSLSIHNGSSAASQRRSMTHEGPAGNCAPRAQGRTASLGIPCAREVNASRVVPRQRTGGATALVLRRRLAVVLGGGRGARRAPCRTSWSRSAGWLGWRRSCWTTGKTAGAWKAPLRLSPTSPDSTDVARI